MKYAFMSFSCPDLSLSQFISLCQRFGYDGLEPRIALGHNHGIDIDMSTEARQVARKQFEEANVPVCCIATSCCYADPQSSAQMTQATRQCIDLAADLNAPCLRVFGGQIGQGLTRQDAIELVAKSLVAVAEHARQRRVILCMETHDDWCNPDDVAEVMRRINHPNIGVNWDIMHPLRVASRTIGQAFATLRPWIRHVHIHDGREVDEKLELVPIGQGFVDHRCAVDLLAQFGYDGYISGEWINWESYETHLPRELATMRAYEAALS